MVTFYQICFRGGLDQSNSGVVAQSLISGFIKLKRIPCARGKCHCNEGENVTRETSRKFGSISQRIENPKHGRVRQSTNIQAPNSREAANINLQ